MPTDPSRQFRPSLMDDPFFFESRKVPWDSKRPTAHLLRDLFSLDDVLPRRSAVALKPDNALDEYLAGQVAAVRSEIGRLQNEAEARAQIHSQSIVELDYQIGQAANSLEQFSPWGIGYNRGVDQKRNFLEGQLATLRRERRNAFVKGWQDVRTLRDELQKAVTEYKSLLNRFGLL